MLTRIAEFVSILALFAVAYMAMVVFLCMNFTVETWIIYLVMVINSLALIVFFQDLEISVGKNTMIL